MTTAGGAHPPTDAEAAGSTDLLLPYTPLLTMVRWAAVLVGLVLTVSQRRGGGDAAAGALLLLHALARSYRPLRFGRGWARALPLLAEVAAASALVGSTGWWASPFAVTLVPGVVAAGLGGGFGVAVPVTVAVGGLTTLGQYLAAPATTAPTSSGVIELLLVGLVAAYGQRIFGRAELRTATVLSRMHHLAEANDLLSNLNRVALNLPVSLDLGDTVRSTITQLRQLIQADTVAVLVCDGDAGSWRTAVSEGVSRWTLDPADLPLAVRLAQRVDTGAAAAFLVSLAAGTGLEPSSQIGIYAPLVARRSLVGVLALECRQTEALHVGQLEFVTGVSEQAALAIDNALLFGHLRSLGAEEERGRLARDLHDRVAQDLAYVAFELDRIAEVPDHPQLRQELRGLSRDTRRTLGELRETMSDLRAEVTEADDLPSIIGRFLVRVEGRSGLGTAFCSAGDRRLALPLERELWRIAQEGILNAERHSRATSIGVSWTIDDRAAELAIVDDGVGILRGAPRADSFGLVGMRERADMIGATLDVGELVTGGTCIRCRVDLAS